MAIDPQRIIVNKFSADGETLLAEVTLPGMTGRLQLPFRLAEHAAIGAAVGDLGIAIQQNIRAGAEQLLALLSEDPPPLEPAGALFVVTGITDGLYELTFDTDAITAVDWEPAPTDPTKADQIVGAVVTGWVNAGKIDSYRCAGQLISITGNVTVTRDGVLIP